MITLVGFMFPLVTYVLLFTVVEDGASLGPMWFYLLFSVGLFTYQTLDNVDGKQARATGTSSPLGELFDHGCDAVNVAITAIATAAVLRMGWEGEGVFLVLLSGLIPFYFASWEEYHTGTLYLGYVNGPTEGILAVCAGGLVTALGGGHAWVAPASHTLPGPIVAVAEALIPDAGTTPLNLFTIWGLMPFIAVTAAASIFSVVRHTKKGISVAMMQLIPLAVFLVSAWLWLSGVSLQPVGFDSSSSSSSGVDDVVQPWVLFTAVTFVFGELVGRVITSHLLKLDYSPYGSPALALAVLPALNARLLHWVPDRAAAQASLVAAAFLYVHFVIHVISGFSSFLNIPVLTIPSRPTSPTNHAD